MYGVSLILHTENWAMTSVGWLSSETQTISLSSPQHQPSSFGLCSKSCPQLNIVTVFSPRKSMCLIKNPGIPDIKYARNFAILIPASVNTGSLLKKKKSITYNSPGSPLTLSTCTSIQCGTDVYYMWVGSLHPSLLILVHVKFAIWTALKSEVLHLLATVVK